MSKYASLIADLETSSDSFNTVAKRHGHLPATAYNGIARIRPDLLTPRSERLGFSRLPGPNSVDVKARDAAVARVLAGERVKDVAAQTGMASPSLYKHAAAERAKQAEKEARTKAKAPPTTSDPINPMQQLQHAVKVAVASGHTKEQILNTVLASLQPPTPTTSIIPTTQRS